MTFIEFFDKSPIENILSAFTMRPDKIVFVGESKVMNRSIPAYEKFLKQKSVDIKLEMCPVNKNNLWDIVSKLSDVLADEEECAFDLTGGEDLLLVAVGIVFQEYRNCVKLHMHRFNMRNGTVMDCDNDGEIPFTFSQKLSVEDWVALHGGVVVRRATEGKSVIEKHKADICKIWNLCSKNPTDWNAHTGHLHEFQKYTSESRNSLRVCIDLPFVSKQIQNMDLKLSIVKDFLTMLNEANLICDFDHSNNQKLSFVYKNAFVKNSIAKSGEILESKILQIAYDMKKGNEPYFSDVDRGVFIDWDGILHTQEERKKTNDTENEIDVVAIHNLEPIFISCKNGGFDDEELYKLYTVSNHFGGSYAKRILICSNSSEHIEKYPHLAQRAKDMDITIISGIQKMTDAEIQEKLKSAIS